MSQRYARPITVNVDDEERDKIERAAKIEASRGVSTWVRQVALRAASRILEREKAKKVPK